jgi:DNA-binding NarL/FixJ family response regulator
VDFASLANPFSNFKLDDVVTIPPGDVPELHEAALEQCHLAITTARKASASSSVMVVGEAGSGKSHMIAQLRKAIATDPKAVLTAVRMGGANGGCLWRHLRERIASDLLRPLPNKDFGENGLLRVLRNRFPKWAEEEESASAILKLRSGNRTWPSS